MVVGILGRTKRSAGLACVVLSLLALSGASPRGSVGFAAQEQTTVPQTSPRGTIRLDVNLVLVEATVKDKSGRILPDLKMQDFQILEEGQHQQIAHFSRDELPLAVALVIQQNRWSEPFYRPLRYATLSVLQALKPEDRVALFSFNDDVQRLVDLTRDKRKVADRMDFPAGKMGTNINDAVYQAAKYLRDTAPDSRRAIILVSDNTPEECRPGVSHKLVLDTALESDAPVYSLKLPYRGPKSLTTMLEHWLVNVEKLATETGGEVIDVQKEGSLFLSLQKIVERLKMRYTLGFYPARKSADGKFRRLELQLGPSFGRKGKDYFVFARTGYFAPRPNAASR